MTMIARVADGLPLAASIQEDEQVTNTNYRAKLVSIYLKINMFIMLHVFIHISDGKEYCGLSTTGKATI